MTLFTHNYFFIIQIPHIQHSITIFLMPECCLCNFIIFHFTAMNCIRFCFYSFNNRFLYYHFHRFIFKWIIHLSFACELCFTYHAIPFDFTLLILNLTLQAEQQFTTIMRSCINIQHILAFTALHYIINNNITMILIPRCWFIHIVSALFGVIY